MNNDQQDIERITKDLLKKSLLTPSSPDFDDLLMIKIQDVSFQEKQKLANNTMKKAWQFLMLALFLFVGSLFILSVYSDSYFSDISGIFDVIANYILYGGLALFVPLVLFQFDALIYTFFLDKRKKIMLS